MAVSHLFHSGSSTAAQSWLQVSWPAAQPTGGGGGGGSAPPLRFGRPGGSQRSQPAYEWVGAHTRATGLHTAAGRAKARPQRVGVPAELVHDVRRAVGARAYILVARTFRREPLALYTKPSGELQAPTLYCFAPVDIRVAPEVLEADVAAYDCPPGTLSQDTSPHKNNQPEFQLEFESRV